MTARKAGRSWVADFYHYGKRIRKQGFATKSAAIRYEQDYLKSLEVSGRPLDDRLSDLVQLWHEYHGCTLKDSRQRLARLQGICERLGNPFVSDFTALSWARYRKARMVEVTGSTVNHEQRYLSAVFSELERLGFYHGENPLRGVRQVKLDEAELTYLELDEVKRLLIECKASLNNHCYPVALICLATGCRWGEAETVRRSSFRHGKVHFVGTKNGRSRSVPLPDSVVDEAFKVGMPGSGRLFMSCRSAFRGAYERCQFDTPGQCTHILRHTFASHYMMQGGDILSLQKILGHTDIKMTMRYAHLSPDHLANVLQLSPLALIG